MKILDQGRLTHRKARTKKKSKNDKDNCNSYMAQELNLVKKK